MKAKLLFLLPAIAMLIACGSNNEQSSGNTSTSQGGTTSGETSQETSEGSSQETSSSEGGESSGGESSSEASEYQTVVFTPTESDKTAAGKYQLTSGGVTIAVSNGMIDANYETKVIEIRIYKNATLTITANEITKAVFNCTAEGTAKQGPGCFSDATAGEYTYSGAVGTWTGKAPTFTLTASSNQVRCTSIEVTYK